MRPIRVKSTVARHVMNKTEARYAELLELHKRTGSIIEWRWEPIKLRLGSDHKTTYTPDFAVVLPDGLLELHEVKGFLREDANVKIKTAAYQYPWFTFKLCRWVKKAWMIEEVR
jgi:hypothetical protein